MSNKAEFVKWSEFEGLDDDNKSKGKNPHLFVKIEPGDKVQLRMVGKAVKFSTAYINGQTYIVPPEYEEKVASISGVSLRKQYAMQCFDRADTAKGITRLKILQKGPTVFEHIGNYANEAVDENGQPIDPGGINGPDLKISRVGKGRDTKYKVVIISQVPFTKEEKKLLIMDPDSEDAKGKPLGQRGKINLQQYFNMERAANRLEEEVFKNAKGIDNDDETEDVSKYIDSEDATEEEADVRESLNEKDGVSRATDKQKKVVASKSSDFDDEELDNILESMF